MNARREVTPEYIYTTIPAEYVCVYHRILAMLADYGEEMLKDCKASCSDRNSNVIECKNMFDAAVAARTLGQDKKAALIINYIKAKINQIYKGLDNSTSFVFPIDENGKLKAFVSCNDRPRFYVDGDELYKVDQGLGFEEEYSLEDENNPKLETPFDFTCEAEFVDDKIVANLHFTYNGFELTESELEDVSYEYYVNEKYIPKLEDYVVEDHITTALRVVAYYKGNVNNHTYVINLV